MDTPATEEWVRQFVLRLMVSKMAELWPVGAVYVNVTNVNPQTELGFGTWVAIGAGRALVGYSVGDPDFGTLEGTAGATSVAPTGSTNTVAAHSHTYTDVVNHTHTLTITDPAHSHSVPILSGSTGSPGTRAAQGVSDVGDDVLLTSDATPGGVSSPTNNPTGGVATGTTATGGSHSHTAGTLTTKVVQPSIVVCFWKRTA